jgi:hypothetical protein
MVGPCFINSNMTLEGFTTSLFNDLNSLLKSYNPSNKVDFWVLRRWPTKKPKGTPFPFSQGEVLADQSLPP